MAGLEPPSFSLGLEADFEHEDWAKRDELETDSDNLNPQSCVIVDSDKEGEQNEPSSWSFHSPPKNEKRNLKRLRRGKLTDVASPPKEEDIEEFSSQDELTPEARNSTPYNSVCSSSKIPLHSSKPQTSRPSEFRKSETRNQSPNPPLSSTLDLGCNGVMLPKLTISPIRRFQLIDSDSDGDNPSSTSTPFRKETLISSSSNNQKKRKNFDQIPDLWKDFEPFKPSRIETPALDEFCNEYFNSLRSNPAPKRGNTAVPERGKAEFCRFPAHDYFFNEDERIRKLVSSRLSHFTPLTGETHQSNINYIGQFKGNASNQRGTSTSKTPTRGRKKRVPDQGSTDKPKNVAKRRVVANEGHWYTSSDGKKVYVSKSGNELSGQGAYRCYKKENGGFRKFKNIGKAKKKKK